MDPLYRLRRLARSLARASVADRRHPEPDPELPVADPYVIDIEQAVRERGRRDFYITVAGPDFDDPPIVVSRGYPYTDT